MSALTLTITNAGRNAIVNASHDGTNAVHIAKAGVTASVFTPAVTQTTLPGEIKQVTSVSGGTVAADTIHATIADASTDSYDVHGFAFYLTDGTLFAIYSQADTIISKAPSGTLLLALDVALVNMSGVTVTFGGTEYNNPSATEDVKGVVELATAAETQAGTDKTRGVHPFGLLTAFTAWLAAATVGAWTASNDGAGSGLDAGLLAGQLPAYYTDIASRLGFTPPQQGGGAGQTTTKIYIGWSGTRLKAQQGSTDLGNFVFDSNIADVWRSSNDGAGSGLDAGLFAGQLPSYYTDIVGRLGYTPWWSGNDGAGSGLDAGLLAGQLPSYYTDIAARLGFTPVQQGGGGGQGTNKIFIGWGSGGLRLQVDGSDLGPLVLASSLTDVWRSSNDGSGSGLDAGLFAGQGPGYYTDIPSRLGYTPWYWGNDGSGSGMDTDYFRGLDPAYFTGYTDNAFNAIQDLSNGNGKCLKQGRLVMMSGTRSISGDQEVFQPYPVTLTAVMAAGVSTRMSGNFPSAQVFAYRTRDPQTDGIYMANQSIGSIQTVEADWYAWGYI
jgi:hypothetical protein